MTYPATPKDVNGLPISAIYVPNVGWVALQGSASTNTDSLGNVSTTVVFSETNSASILAALGAVGDAAWSGSGNGDMIAILKKLVGNQAGPYNVQGASNTPLAQASTGSGLSIASLLALTPYLDTSGGPLDATGKPQAATTSTLKSILAKVRAGSSTNITSTNTGDTSLTFSSAPKTLYPGAQVDLYVGAGTTPVEQVIVSQSFVPSSTATVISLQNPVVNASSTTAKWDTFGALGPQTNVFTGDGMLGVVGAEWDNSDLAFYLPSNAALDGNSRRLVRLATPGLVNSSNGIDAQRGNLDNIALIASAAYTTTQTGADQINYNHRGLIVVLYMSNAGTGSVTLEVDGKDPVSGQYYSLLTGAAVTSNSTNVYYVYPGVPVTANVSASYPLPRTWRVKVTANNANSATYSVGASLIV